LINTGRTKNREQKNANTEKFIDGNQSSLASLRGKPTTKKKSITIILRTRLSHAF
jgi:hypothetical protein